MGAGFSPAWDVGRYTRAKKWEGRSRKGYRLLEPCSWEQMPGPM